MVFIFRLGLLLGLLGISACSYQVDTHRVEADIKADIERQGRRISLKAVTCPDNVSKQAEAYFRCVGELPTGEIFTINVIQQDDQGNVAWEIPSSKALINLVSLEEEISQTLSKALGKRFQIDCGEAYRINQSGDAFECDVVGAVTVGAEQIPSVLVRVEPDGNLKWQEFRQPALTLPPTTAPTPSSTPTTAEQPALGAKASTEAATPASQSAAAAKVEAEAEAEAKVYGDQ